MDNGRVCLHLIFTFQYGEIKSAGVVDITYTHHEFTFQYGEIKSQYLLPD